MVNLAANFNPAKSYGTNESFPRMPGPGSGGKALASQLLNSRDGLLLTLTIYFPFTAEEFCKAVKVSAQQPLLRGFRLLVIFQDIKDGLIDDRQK
jgi:hypothetical protein